MTDFGHGSKAVFKIDNLAGSLVDISSYLIRAGIKATSDTIDVTTVGDKWNDYDAISRDVTITLEGNFDGDVNTYIGSIFQNVGTVGQVTERSWEFYPRGTTAGKPKFYGECLLTEWDVDSPRDGAVTWSAILLVPRGATFTTV